ncbi:ATP phosphoribosyltransferase regulatory subunit [uncultured Abyssibacter sp.]|mgnify:CR=1 FL=1|uniref:ATP phosphoribosyltransferase regulatory subunit n=1 Tax=uncultured Abyssibacter sp. TaxID=2320202 RepID=UPI0032B29C95
MTFHAWTLPDGVEEVLAPDAWVLETLRRDLIDLYRSWGYAFVLPPLIEYIESLLTGAGRELDVQTFKLTDQNNGRLMGLRADMTPQIARIDANRMLADSPARLCYTGTVLRARPGMAASSRALRQIGVELFGHAGVESDREVLSLMIATLRTAGIDNFHLDLGHVGVVRALLAPAALSPDLEADVFNVLQRKSVPDLEWMRPRIGDALADQLGVLMRLNGTPDVLETARSALAGISPDIDAALDELAGLCGWLAAQEPDLAVHVDLAELRGYHYHTGVVFAAFVEEHGRELARGGRYDFVGEAFGRGRPATGFSSDLNVLTRVANRAAERVSVILAPGVADPALDARVRELRAGGEVVVQALPGQACPEHDRHLALQESRWTIQQGSIDDPRS